MQRPGKRGQASSAGGISLRITRQFMVDGSISGLIQILGQQQECLDPGNEGVMHAGNFSSPSAKRRAHQWFWLPKTKEMAVDWYRNAY